MDWIIPVKIAFLLAFVMFIPASAACFSASRTAQRNAEIERYMSILEIKADDEKLFMQTNPVISLYIAVSFVTFLTACFWSLIMFGADIKFASEYNYLLGNSRVVQEIGADAKVIEKYQSGALLSFNMAFLGSYLWGIQNITRRYSMNDLIPISYYYLGVRMIFASILALVFYSLAEVVPNPFVATVTPVPANPGDPPTELTATHLVTPAIAFLIGMFPQRALNWLTDKISIFTPKNNSSVRDLPLDMIEGITVYDRVRLQELGIDGCYDLANVDYIPCLFKTPYSPRILISWILQAKMCIYFGEHVKDLREHGFHTVWQINEYELTELKELVKSSSLTEAKLVLVKKLISEDREIKRLVAAQRKLSQYWSATKEEVTDLTEKEI